MKITCIIIDDEPLAIKVIESYLKDFKNIELLATFNHPLKAVEFLEEHPVDAVFIDINMPRLNGLEFIRNTQIKTHFIITTAYMEYAVESFDLDVFDYLVKPIAFDRFLKTINKLAQQMLLEKQSGPTQTETEKSFIFLKVDKKLIKVKYDDIYYIESLKDYIRVFTRTGNFMVHKSLTSITEELPAKCFLRIHRSFTIALDKVEFLEGNSVSINKTRIPIGRKYIDHAKNAILNSI